MRGCAPHSIHRSAGLTALAVLLALSAPSIAAEELDRHGLFSIERNKNANIVQYDAMTEQGRLRKKNPVEAYWIRLASDGEVRKLSWVQRSFAYGFKATHDKEADTITLKMVAKIGRPITVSKVGEAYRAIMEIDGATCVVEKFFIDSSGSGMGTKVNFTEFFGNDVDTGAECYEKLLP